MTAIGIIPFYNEVSSLYQGKPYMAYMFPTIQKSLETGVLEKVIWVDDGSADESGDLVRSFVHDTSNLGKSQEIITLQRNSGKATAWYVGVINAVPYLSHSKSQHRTIVMLDADLYTLTSNMIRRLTIKLEKEGLDMVMGTYIQDLQECIPDYSGFRAIRLESLITIVDRCDHKYSERIGLFLDNRTGYGLETVLNWMIPQQKTDYIDFMTLKSRGAGDGAFSIDVIEQDILHIKKKLKKLRK